MRSRDALKGCCQRYEMRKEETPVEEKKTKESRCFESREKEAPLSAFLRLDFT